MDDRGLYNLSQIYNEDKSKLNIDILAKVKYLEQEKSERTIWVHPIMGINLQNLKSFLENTHKCGIVLDIRVRRGKKYPNKNGENLFGFVEFADSTSVTRALNIASRKLNIVDGDKFRMYRAGTGTFNYVKKSARQKKIEFAVNSLPSVPYVIQKVTNQMRERGPNRMAPRGRGGRGRGRGRGRR